jgi:hypothetical protein
MSRRKGEISPAVIDRRWPFQVALHAEICTDDQFAPLHGLGQSLNAAPRWRHVTKKEATGYEATYNLVCFARKEEAQAFIDQAGGRHFDPVKDREGPKNRNIWTWHDWGEPHQRYSEIIARLERARGYEPPLDADIAMLLAMRWRLRFTGSLEEVTGFLVGRLPQGDFEYQLSPHIDAWVRHAPDEPWRAACEGRTKPRDSLATALTLAFLRGWTAQ